MALSSHASSRAAGRRARVLLLLALAAALLGLPGLTPAAGAADPLISQGKPATASSTENAGLPGVRRGRRQPRHPLVLAAADPQWIQVDLGATAAVTQVVLHWEAAYGRAFQIQTATTATGPFTTVFTTTTGTGGTQTLAVTGTGRYVRMNGTARATQYGYSLWEFQVRVAGTAPPTGTETLLSYGKPAPRPRPERRPLPNCVPAKAFDNDPATRWATAAWVDPGWIYVDLGATAQSTRSCCSGTRRSPRRTRSRSRRTANTWTPIYSTTTGTGFKETLTVNGTGRYVRMYGTARATATATRCGSSRCTAPAAARSRRRPPPPTDLPGRPAGLERRVQRPPAPARHGQVDARDRHRPEQRAAVLHQQPRTPPSTAPAAWSSRPAAETTRARPAGGPCHYTSRPDQHRRQVHFTYGRVEARIKVRDARASGPRSG